MLLDCVIFIYYLTHLELFVAFSKVNNQLVSSFKHDGIIKETRGGNSNFDVILQILMRNKYVAHLGSSFIFDFGLSVQFYRAHSVRTIL